MVALVLLCLGRRSLHNVDTEDGTGLGKAMMSKVVCLVADRSHLHERDLRGKMGIDPRGMLIVLSSSHCALRKRLDV